jgi:fermentation-respiration switch protein FrsA (DUF1100 family)
MPLHGERPGEARGLFENKDILSAARLLPQLASADPVLAIANFIGRPLLMLNGKRDSTISPPMGQRLFNAAAEPKELRWYDSGHRLPDKAYEDAAEWVSRTWADVGDRS